MKFKLTVLISVVTLLSACGAKQSADVFAPEFVNAVHEVAKTEFFNTLNSKIENNFFNIFDSLPSYSASLRTSQRTVLSYYKSNDVVASSMDKIVNQERAQYDSNNVILELTSKTDNEGNNKNENGESSSTSSYRYQDLVYLDGTSLIDVDTSRYTYKKLRTATKDDVLEFMDDYRATIIDDNLKALSSYCAVNESDNSKYYIDGDVLTYSFSKNSELDTGDYRGEITKTFKIQFTFSKEQITEKVMNILEEDLSSTDALTTTYNKKKGKVENYIDMSVSLEDVKLSKVDLKNYQLVA